MATTYVLANNVNTTLASGISSGATTITLTSSANLPTLSAGQVMPLTLNDAATQDVFEIVYVTAIAGANLTVLRAQEGTTAQAWLAGDYAFSTLTAGIANQYIQPGNEGGSGFVQLNPASTQSGSVKVSGSVNAGSASLSGTLSGTDAAFTGNVLASNDGVHQSYAPIAYISNGASVGSTWHIVTGGASVDITSGANAWTAIVGLTGPAQFADTTYNVFVTIEPPAYIAASNTAGQVALVASAIPNDATSIKIIVTTADMSLATSGSTLAIRFCCIGE